MSSQIPLTNQLERMIRGTNNDKLAFAVTGLTVVLLGAMVLKECKGILREDHARGR